MPRETTQFRAGHGRAGGRQKGIPNKVTREVRAAARRLVADREYRRNLRERLRAGTAGQMEVVLWQYAYGKPKDAQGHDGEVTIHVEYERDAGSARDELARRFGSDRGSSGRGGEDRSAHVAADVLRHRVTGSGKPC